MNTVAVEWRRLVHDGRTCDRCGDTGAMLRQLVASLDAECAGQGTRVKLKETELGPERIAESNLVLIEGQPLERLLAHIAVGHTHCASCEELTGQEQACRAFQLAGETHEVPPPYLVRQAVCRIAACC